MDLQRLVEVVDFVLYCIVEPNESGKKRIKKQNSSNKAIIKKRMIDDVVIKLLLL